MHRSVYVNLRQSPIRQALVIEVRGLAAAERPVAAAMTAPRQEGWKHSFAGGVAGSVAVVALHPFDVIKTRLQVQDGHQAQQATYQGALDAAKNMYRREGWKAFYNGLTPAWLGSGVAWAAYFYAYERTKAMYLGWSGGERLGTLWTTLSAAQAGAMVCLLTNPIWLIKTRLQLQQQDKFPAALGSVSAAAATATAPLGQATARKAVERSLAAGPGPGSAPAAHIGPSGASAAASAAPYRGMLDAVVRIGREEGIRGYYKGLAPSLVLTCHGAIQFTVYEELKHLFSTLTPTWVQTSTNSLVQLGSQPAAPSSLGLDADAGPLPPAALRHSSPSGIEDAATTNTSLSEPAPSTSAATASSTGHALPAAYRQLSSFETSLCAVLSKLSASVMTYPSQVVRSRLQQRFDNRNLVYKGALQTVALTWRNEGLRGFYRGLGPALMRTLPQSAVTLTVYEKVLQLMPGPASSG